MNNNRKVSNSVKNNLILVVLAFLFLLVFSNGTSPLSKYYGSDSAFFMFVGKAMNHGLKPYIDLFDHKGPYLFWIQQLGQLICENRYGAFIMQVINLSICMYIIDRVIILANNELPFDKRLLCQIPLAIVFAISFRDGNMCEEYSLSFLFISLYMLIKYFIQYENGDYKHNLIYAFIYGLFFGILVFIRITNSAFLCSCVLATTILLIYKKEYKNLLLNILVFLLGTLIAFLPIYLYYSSIGGLETMLYSVFVYAVKYVGELSFIYRLKLYVNLENILLLISAFYPVIYLFLIKENNTKYFIFACISFVATFAATFIGQAYTHYFVLVLPNVLYAIFLFLHFNVQKSFKSKKKTFVILTTVIMVGLSVYMFLNLGKNILQIVDYSMSENKHNYYLDLSEIDKEIGECIPDEEKTSVWGYGTKARFYIQSNTYPCIRYFDYLDQRLAYSDISKEIETLLKKNKPKWLVVSKEREEIPKFISEEINAKYSLYTENEGYYLYNRIYE